MVNKIYRGIQAGTFVLISVGNASQAMSTGNGFMRAAMFGAFLGLIALVVVSFAMNIFRNIVGV